MNERTIAIYTRVSTGYQVEKDSLPHQRKELLAYCDHVLHLPMDKIEVFEDAGKSGKNTDRPAYQRLMKKVRGGQVSHVIVYKIDRISRNLVDFSLMYDDFKYNRVTFISLNEQFDTSTAMGETMLKIILVFAELERKLTSERVTDVMIGRALEGKWNGARVPYGWDWDTENQIPVHHPAESSHARMMYDLYEETKSSSRVRDYCNAHDIPTKRGGEWTSKTVADFIRNPMNKGDYRYNYRESARGRKKPEDEVIYVKGVFPPLVDPEQWERCNAIMDKNAAAKHRIGFEPYKKHIHVFGGRLRCTCGANFHADKDTRRANGFFPSNYRCGARTRKLSCNSLATSDVLLGPFIFNYIANIVKATAAKSQIKDEHDLEAWLLKGPEFENIIGIEENSLHDTFEMLFSGNSVSYEQPRFTAHSVEQSNISNLKSEKSKLERAMERLKKLYLFDDGAMSEKEYLATKQELDLKLIDINNKIADSEQSGFASNKDDVALVKSISTFFLAHKLQEEEHINYSSFALTVDDKTLKDFVCSVIDTIQIKNRLPISILFKNGLEHRFVYKE